MKSQSPRISESTPLDEWRQSADIRTHEDGIRQGGSEELWWTHLVPSRTAFYFMSMYFLLAFCELVVVAPLVKLFERSLCVSYYDSRRLDLDVMGKEVPEHLCKIPEIQMSLARIRGWKSMLDMIPGK